MGSCASITEPQGSPFQNNKVKPTLLSVLSFRSNAEIPVVEKAAPVTPFVSKRGISSKSVESQLPSFRSEFCHYRDEMVNLIEELVDSFIDVIPKTETVQRHDAMIRRLIKQIHSKTLTEDQTTIFLHYLKQEFEILLTMANRICSPRNGKTLLSPRQQHQLHEIMKFQEDHPDLTSEIGFESTKFNEFNEDLPLDYYHHEHTFLSSYHDDQPQHPIPPMCQSKDEEFRSFIQKSIPRIKTTDLDHPSDKDKFSHEIRYSE